MHYIGLFDNEIEAAQARDDYVVARNLQRKMNFDRLPRVVTDASSTAGAGAASASASASATSTASTSTATMGPMTAMTTATGMSAVPTATASLTASTPAGSAVAAPRAGQGMSPPSLSRATRSASSYLPDSFASSSMMPAQSQYGIMRGGGGARPPAAAPAAFASANGAEHMASANSSALIAAGLADFLIMGGDAPQRHRDGGRQRAVQGPVAAAARSGRHMMGGVRGHQLHGGSETTLKAVLPSGFMMGGVMQSPSSLATEAMQQQRKRNASFMGHHAQGRTYDMVCKGAAAAAATGVVAAAAAAATVAGRRHAQLLRLQVGAIPPPSPASTPPPLPTGGGGGGDAS